MSPPHSFGSCPSASSIAVIFAAVTSLLPSPLSLAFQSVMHPFPFWSILPALGLKLTTASPSYTSTPHSHSPCLLASFLPSKSCIFYETSEVKLRLKWQEIMSFKCQMFQEKEHFKVVFWLKLFFPSYFSAVVRSYIFRSILIHERCLILQG